MHFKTQVRVLPMISDTVTVVLVAVMELPELVQWVERAGPPMGFGRRRLCALTAERSLIEGATRQVGNQLRIS
jgi:hypothetical protein